MPTCLVPHRCPLPLFTSSSSPVPILSRTLRSTAAAMQPSHAHSDVDTDKESNIQQAIAYHNRTKHSLTSGYARGPHGLDWANQPNPFLRFTSSTSAPLLHFPPLPNDSPTYPSLFSASPPSPPRPLDAASLSRLLYDSLSLSAWKSTSFSTWSLRVNPSSGNLHPTEAHVLSPPIPSVSASPFLAHYSPKDHSLHFRSHLPASLFPDRSPTSLFLALSSVFWREAWKYGERALRYCNHDVGHAIAAISISAAALGWDVRLLDAFGHEELKKLLGVDETYPPPPSPLPDRPCKGNFPWIEAQHPDCLLQIFPFGTDPNFDHSSLVAQCGNLEWAGKPNALSKEHVYWDAIYRTAEAIKKPSTFDRDRFSVSQFRPSGLISEKLYKDFTIRQVVRKRRSAVDMDGVHVMDKDTFYQILLHCLPSGELGPGDEQGRQMALPFRTLTWDAEVHAALFVHSVKDLPKGLYFLVRNEAHLERLRLAMRADFEWERPEGCPDGLPLYRLASGNCKRLAKQLSCHQDIASDGCFSLGMVARFEPVLREKGAWMYPRLFWETGVLGQILYLEAHAVGISATGIGCYFDDDVHEVLGLKGSEFQSLYHFTIGSPVIDKRIMSLPAYPGPGIDA